MRLQVHLRLRAQLTIVVFLSTLMLLLAVVVEVKANSQQQTVPTMPPPTKSPTVTNPGTPISSPENTPTYSLQPSTTSVQATLLPPAQTATANATRTEVPMSNSPTTTIEQATISSGIVTGTTSAQGNASLTVSPLISTQLPASQEQPIPMFNLIIGAGAGLLFLIVLIIWIWRRKTRTK